MINIIKTFKDGSYIYYGKGSFDDYCVYIEKPNIGRIAPRDYDYFTRIKQISKEYGSDKIYDDFLKLYSVTSDKLKQNILDGITRLTSTYGKYSEELNQIFTILYMGMVAEECKKNTKLGKRIKRLGMHELLAKDESAEYAASFMRGMSWRNIDSLCKERGF